MRIESSAVSYVTTHRSASATTVVDETRVRGRAADVKVAVAKAAAASDAGVRQPVAVDTVQLLRQAGSGAANDREDLLDLDPKQRLASLVIEALFGFRLGRVRFHAHAHAPTTSSNGAPAGGSAALGGATPIGGAPGGASPPGGAPPGGPVVAERRAEFHSESEQTSFQASGTVETADGRSIEFQATLSMQREFQSYAATTRSGNATDPLVVNFGGAPARLTGGKISFDLNSDGNPESISLVAGDSGFLMLDRNGDGQATDGSELFGPQTGNGFAELRSYDADGNGWIDENDPVFSKLRVWTQDGLSTLSEKGVGAISTSSVETPFALTDSANSLQGNVRSSGVYLYENGAAGTIQQVDLAEG